VRVGASDWHLDAGAAELQRQLVTGWAGAARVMAPADASAIDAWTARRLGHIDAGRSRIVVGHHDLAAFDEAPRR
jgi:hypothetical protein